MSPPRWIRRRPLGFETVTLHVDRPALDGRLCEHARALGTTFVWERVARIETAGDRVTGCITATGRRVEARWYLDASGTTQAIYQPALRRGLGFEAAVYVYTIFAFFMNALHARFDPRGPIRMAAFSCIFAAARVWVAGATLVGRAVLRLRGPASDCGSRWV